MKNRTERATQIEAWHFVKLAGTTDYLCEPEQVGKTYSISGPLELCKNGLHGSIKALDALEYGAGPLCRRTLHTGEILEGTDKLCSRERTVLWQFNATQVLHLFAVEVAEEALLRYGGKWGDEVNPRSWEALRIKRSWLQGKATDQELNAAGAAAKVAACAAACAACAAAYADASAAAWAAVRDAVRDACDAARAAAKTSASAATYAAGYAAASVADSTAAKVAAKVAAWAAINSKLEQMLEEGRK